MSGHSLFSKGLLCVSLVWTVSLAEAQDLAVDVARQYVQDNAATLGLTDADVRGMKLTDVYASNRSGVTHVYLQQRHQGIGVHNGLINVNVRGSEVLSVGNRFVSNLAGRTATSVPGLSAAAAASAAAGHVGLAVTEPLTVRESTPGPEQAGRLSRGGFALEDIPVRLVYQQLENGDVHLAWDVGIYTLDAQHYWSSRVDAATGAVLDQQDLVVHDNWGTTESASGAGLFAPPASVLLKTSAADAATTLNPDSYNVFPLPAESPLHPVGSGTPQSLESNPASATASPFGWHDTDGSPGAEFTITRGNNVHAYQDQNNTGTPSMPEPDGGASLDFNFVFDFGVDPTDATTANASITNLFYWSNVSHDVLYEYGFDEPAGNFQVNNYGNGGLGADDVRAEGQDGGGNCNANMLTPSDGSRPRMQMYLCANVVPRRDGDLDHGVVIHEYVHGLSNRLTGGPANVSCLNNTEQMGEGWSDWYGLAITQQPGDTGPQARGIGTYLFGQPPNGPGIRARPYSTDFAVNDFTYDNIKTASVPHGIGHVWATMIWDLTWALIGGDPNFPDIPNGGDNGAGGGSGFDADLYNGTGGNNLALQLVTDGLKLQPCSPGFVDGRDAILAADAALTGGLNECAIWHVFARRGLGHSANQGTSGSRSDGTEAYDLPPGIPATCGVAPPMADLSLTKTVDNPNPNVGDNVTFTVTVTNGGPDDATGVAVGDPLPSGFTHVSSTTTQGTYNSGTGEWSVGTILNGGNAVLTITAEVLATGDHDNVAQVTASDLGDPDSTPNNNVPSEDDQDNATAAPPAPEPTDVHVDNIVTGTESAPKGRKRGTATVTVFDDLGGPAAGYTVNGTFSGSISESASGTTGPDGTVTLVTTGSTKSKNPTIDFCVDSIDGSLPYDKSDNTDPAYDCGGNGNPTTMHVESIVTGQQGAGGGEKRGTATVTIFSDLESAVSDATVMGTFSGDLDGPATGVTGADGTVLLTTADTKRGKVNVSFCVDSVTHAPLTYVRTDNHDPGADCNSLAKRGELAESVPATFALEQNYPNPFNPSTRIGFQLPEAEYVRLSVYDVMGREVARLVDRPMEAGVHHATFDASTLPSGTYVYRITTDTNVDTRRMVLVK